MAADPLDPQGAALAPAVNLPADPGRATSMLYKRHGTTVFRYTWHMLGRREDAEDATQATFLAAHVALAEGTKVREPRAWLMRIARNECLQRIQATMRAPLTDELDDVVAVAATAPSVERQVELRWDMTAAKRALGELPVAQREAFVLREWCGLSPVEVGAALDRSVSSVDALIHRARKELMRGVGEREGAAGCTHTRARIEDGELDRKARAHLVRCAGCRAARKGLAPDVERSLRGLVPPAAIADTLGSSIPGFAAASGGLVTGGGVAAAIAKLAAAPVAAKLGTTALVAVAVTGGTLGVERSIQRDVHRPEIAAAAEPQKPKAPPPAATTAQAPEPVAPAPATAVGVPVSLIGSPAKSTGSGRSSSRTARARERARQVRERRRSAVERRRAEREHRNGSGDHGSGSGDGNQRSSGDGGGDGGGTHRAGSGDGGSHRSSGSHESSDGNRTASTRHSSNGSSSDGGSSDHQPAGSSDGQAGNGGSSSDSKPSNGAGDHKPSGGDPSTGGNQSAGGATTGSDG